MELKDIPFSKILLVVISMYFMFCSSFFLFPQVVAFAHTEPKQWLHLDRVAYFFLIRETLLWIAPFLCFIAVFRDKVWLLKPFIVLMYIVWPLTLVVHFGLQYTYKQDDHSLQLFFRMAIYPHYLIILLAAVFADNVIENKTGERFISNGTTPVCICV